MSSYLEHPSRASRYADGGYVVYPQALDEDTTVWFSIDPDDGTWEGILAIREGPSRARLVGVPLWTYGVNLDDVIEIIDSREGAPVAVGVAVPSSNRTLRVVFPDLGPDEEDDRWRQILIDLEPCGCWFDVLRPGYLAISVPEKDEGPVERYLNDRAARGDLMYERADVTPER